VTSEPATLTFLLRIRWEDGTDYELSAKQESAGKTQRHLLAQFDQTEKERVLAWRRLQGDYTLAWAAANDLRRRTKEIWDQREGVFTKRIISSGSALPTESQHLSGSKGRGR
jgi:hypothetical protein